jgi:hypothetical protein
LGEQKNHALRKAIKSPSAANQARPLPLELCQSPFRITQRAHGIWSSFHRKKMIRVTRCAIIIAVGGGTREIGGTGSDGSESNAENAAKHYTAINPPAGGCPLFTHRLGCTLNKVSYFNAPPARIAVGDSLKDGLCCFSTGARPAFPDGKKKAGQSRAEQGRAEQGRAGQGRAEQHLS